MRQLWRRGRRTLGMFEPVTALASDLLSQQLLSPKRRPLTRPSGQVSDADHARTNRGLPRDCLRSSALLSLSLLPPHTSTLSSMSATATSPEMPSLCLGTHTATQFLGPSRRYSGRVSFRCCPLGPSLLICSVSHAQSAVDCAALRLFPPQESLSVLRARQLLLPCAPWAVSSRCLTLPDPHRPRRSDATPTPNSCYSHHPSRAPPAAARDTPRPGHHPISQPITHRRRPRKTRTSDAIPANFPHLHKRKFAQKKFGHRPRQSSRQCAPTSSQYFAPWPVSPVCRRPADALSAIHDGPCWHTPTLGPSLTPNEPVLYIFPSISCCVHVCFALASVTVLLQE